VPAVAGTLPERPESSGAVGSDNLIVESLLEVVSSATLVCYTPISTSH